MLKSLVSRFAVVAMLAMASLMAAPAVQAQALSDYLENKLIDHVFRNTAYVSPTVLAVGLFTTACSDAAAGTEVATGAYARGSLAPSLVNWAGTQGAASTVASTGTGGQTSNNAVITFPTPSATWGTVTHMGLFDAATAGNLLICQALTTAKTINTGDTVTFPAAAFSITLN